METSEDWLVHFPKLNQIDDPIWSEVLRTVHQIKVPKNTMVFRGGELCSRWSEDEDVGDLDGIA